MKLNLVMPMGGGGTRFGSHGFHVPKPLIEIYGRPFFFWAVQSITKFVDIESIVFVVLKEHEENFGITKKIGRYYPQARIKAIPKVLPGAVLTCMEGAEDIPDGRPVLFNDCDHLFICRSFYEFCSREMFESIDGGMMTFKSDDPKYSFVSYDENGYVNRTAEKQVISEDAVCGAYYFRNKEIFTGAAEAYLKECRYNEFFVSGVYNVMASHGKKIKSFQVDEHVSFGTPDEYEEAKGDLNYRRLL